MIILEKETYNKYKKSSSYFLQLYMQNAWLYLIYKLYAYRCQHNSLIWVFILKSYDLKHCNIYPP